MVPLPAAAREIHAPQINSEAVFNTSSFGDEGFALRFNETFKITLITLGNRTQLNCHLSSSKARLLSPGGERGCGAMARLGWQQLEAAAQGLETQS